MPCLADLPSLIQEFRARLRGNSSYQYTLKHTLSIHPIKIPSPMHPINSPYQYALSINPLNPPCQYALSIHPVNPPCQPTFTHKGIR